MDAGLVAGVGAVGTADAAFVSPVNRRQRVGGSDSTMAYRDTLRLVGAAGARCWCRPPRRAGASPAVAVPDERPRAHAASGRALGFGELAVGGCRAAGAAVAALKPLEALRLTGQRLTRKDTPAKVDGSARSGIDVREPGMLHAALRRSVSSGPRAALTPRRCARAAGRGHGGAARGRGRGGRRLVVARACRRRARRRVRRERAARPGFRRHLGDAASRARRRRARAQQWPFPDFSTRPPTMRPGKLEDVAQVLARRELRQLEATYEVPYLAHLTMEPQVCTVRIGADRCGSGRRCRHRTSRGRSRPRRPGCRRSACTCS